MFKSTTLGNAKVTRPQSGHSLECDVTSRDKFPSMVNHLREKFRVSSAAAMSVDVEKSLKEKKSRTDESTSTGIPLISFIVNFASEIIPDTREKHDKKKKRKQSEAENGTVGEYLESNHSCHTHCCE